MAISNRKVVNPFKPMIKRLPKGLQNRYVLVLLTFAAWMLFFDKASLWTQYKLQRTLNNLENDRVYYQTRLKEVQQQKQDIESNKEKFARERYYMKAADEDVFVVEKE